MSAYADYGNYTLLLTANLTLISAYLPVTGWLLYATSVDFLPGSLSLNLSSSTWQLLSSANSQCTNVGVVDANSGTLTYSMPLAVQWSAPSHLSGNVTFNALVLTSSNSYFFTVPPLSVPPAIPAPSVTAPVSTVNCNASTDGAGGMTFVCWFAGNDGGALVTYIGVFVFASADSVNVVAGDRTLTVPVGSYPTYATFHFSLNVGQTYYFQMYAGNSVGAGPPTFTTLTVSRQSQSTTLPVSASSTSISAGGVFGIVVGCLAAIGLIVLAARFYTRKGHLRQHMQRIDTTQAAEQDGEAEGAEEDVMLDEEEEEEDEAEEEEDNASGGVEQNVELAHGDERDNHERIQS